MPLISIVHHHTHHHYHHNPQELTKMSQQMDNLEAATARLTTVTSSVVGLLAGLSQQIVELKDNPAALERLAQDVNANADRLAQAVILSDGDPTNDPGYEPPAVPEYEPLGNQENNGVGLGDGVQTQVVTDGPVTPADPFVETEAAQTEANSAVVDNAIAEQAAAADEAAAQAADQDGSNN